MDRQKLDVRAMTIAFGVTWGAGVLLLGLLAWLLGWGVPMVTVLGSLYLGFTTTLAGTVIGTIWALVDGAIAGAILAWIYNMAVSRHTAD